MNVQSKKSVAETVSAIAALDLEPIKFKLMDADEGEGWSREYVDQMEVAYKRFLTLLVKHPETPIAPSKDIDKFWHGHILDTLKYAEDCEQVFGYFLHHFPYFGMRGEEDAAKQAQADQDMKRLYAEEFGEPMPQQAAYCMAEKKAAYCMAETKAAYCMASKPATKAAYCMAEIKAAYCMAATKAAYCMASKPATEAAYCMATTKAAYCMASKPVTKAAYCMAAVKAAYCMAEKRAAYCMAANQAAYCMADKKSGLTRPTLALAA